MINTFIGIDNGVTSGGIAIINPNEVTYEKTPVKECLNYTKVKGWIKRLDVPKFRDILKQCNPLTSKLFIERPMVNPGRFKATISAIRCLEASLIVFEELGLSYEYIDSKEWQKALLPSDLEGDELKAASLDVGKRLFPQLANCLKKDADSLLIAEYLRRKETKGFIANLEFDNKPKKRKNDKNYS